MPFVPKLNGANIALVAVFAALIAACTAPPEFGGAAGVPITLQTFGVVLTGLVLGAWRGAAAAALYVLGGLAGLPIFADSSSGLAIVTGATGGYLWAFPIAAFVVGWIVERLRARSSAPAPFVSLAGAGLISMPIIYVIGVPWLAHVIGVPVFTPVEEGGGTALAYGLIPFVAGDVLKVLAAAAVAYSIHRAFPTLLARGSGEFFHVDGSAGEWTPTDAPAPSAPKKRAAASK